MHKVSWLHDTSLPSLTVRRSVRKNFIFFPQACFNYLKSLRMICMLSVWTQETYSGFTTKTFPQTPLLHFKRGILIHLKQEKLLERIRISSSINPNHSALSGEWNALAMCFAIVTFDFRLWKYYSSCYVSE